MEFKHLKTLLQENFAKVTKDSNKLFEVNLDKDALWELYLNSFPDGTNPVFKERREYDCSCCRQFIKNIGNVVVIEDNIVKSIWDFETNDSTFQPVIEALSNYVKSKAVTDVFVSKLKKIGTDKNYEMTDNRKTREWHHFYLELSDQFVDRSSKSEGEIKGPHRDTRNIFKRSLDEITEDSLLTVMELISQNSLYKGEEWKGALNEFLKYKKTYDKLQSEQEKENYTWEQSVKVGSAIGRIKNHSIGTLLINVSEGMDLDEAVCKYEKIVAPENYKRSKPIYNQRQLDSARKMLEEQGYIGSLNRRFATLDDITVNNILFSNRDSAKRISGLNVFDEMATDVAVNAKKFSKTEEVPVDQFINNILPNAKEIEVLFENRHVANMVSLIAPQDKDNKTMFKWDNGISWAYTGNITDSTMKENVKAAGGKVDGDLRFSIQWNDRTEHDRNDLDAYCREPNGYVIYYGTRNSISPTGGRLDVDIQIPQRGKAAVENITWATRNRMRDGVYKFYVNNFANRGGRSGFRAEVEFDGQIYTFDYNKEVRNNEDVMVAEVTLKNGVFSIKELLPSNVSTREVWGLKTNQFIPVSVISYTPNYWNEQEGIGHRHYLFMLKDCINPEQPNCFFNEYLREEFREHRHVLEALGGKLAVKDADDQLSGLGFSSTKRNDILVKVKGVTERVIKVKF